MQRCFIGAQLSICRECLEDQDVSGQLSGDERTWLLSKCGALNSDWITSRGGDHTSSVVGAEVVEIAPDLLTSQLTQTHENGIISRLVQEAVGEDQVPGPYRRLLETDLYGRLLSFFSLELRQNAKVSALFQAELLDLLQRNQASITDVGVGLPRATKIEDGEPTPCDMFQISSGHKNSAIPQRNLRFFGRESYLTLLESKLFGEQRHRGVAIVGPDGVGKTEIAAEYVHRHEDKYSSILWVRADDPVVLGLDYAGLLEAVLPGYGDQRGIPHRVKDVRSWLERSSGWLLVFDGGDDPSIIDSYLPRDAKGHFLVTSQNPAWGTLADVVELQKFSRREAIDFLQSRMVVRHEGLDELVETLDSSPIALEQAVGYIENTGASIPTFISSFRRFKEAGPGLDGSYYWRPSSTAKALS
jgi:hypothetical protein